MKVKAFASTPTIECPNCKYQGKAKKLVKGSSLIELIIWIFGIIGIFFTWGLSILVAIVYSLWRMSSYYYACPKCEYEKVYKIDLKKGEVQ